MRKTLAENAIKKFHVYKVTVVLYTCIYDSFLGIRLPGYPANLDADQRLSSMFRIINPSGNLQCKPEKICFNF